MIHGDTFSLPLVDASLPPPHPSSLPPSLAPLSLHTVFTLGLLSLAPSSYCFTLVLASFSYLSPLKWCDVGSLGLLMCFDLTQFPPRGTHTLLDGTHGEKVCLEQSNLIGTRPSPPPSAILTLSISVSVRRRPYYGRGICGVFF